jgi:Holliday junction DNA helicase RuvA
MIDFLEGVAEDIKENYVIINVNGVGFKVNISFITYNTIKDKQTLRIHTYMNVKEDSIELYGFAFLEEKDVFLQLINISGIGPKAAMSILSNTTIDNFKQAISSGDEDALLKIPGLGSKKAKRILVELKDKFKDIVAIEKGQLSAEDDYVEALTVLGFKYAEAKKAIKEAMKILNNTSNKEEIIKQALKLLGR